METRNKYTWSDFDLFCIVRFVLRNFWMVLISALTCAMLVSLGMTMAVTPTYTSETTFSVTSHSLTSGSTTAATNAIATQFSSLLSSDLVKRDAAELMGLKSFPATVAVSVPENTNIIVMRVTADSPEVAYKSALALYESHRAYSRAIFASAVLDNISGPDIPTAPNRSSTRDTLSDLSAPLGALLMIALLVLFAISADTVQTVPGAKHQVDGELLATLYHEKRQKRLLDRKKTSLLISNPTCSFYYTETIHQLRVRLERSEEHDGSRVFVLTSCGENEGKSTLAANLALSLAQKHQRVLLIDADLRKPAQALIFDAEADPAQSFGALLAGKTNDISSCITTVPNGKLHVLYATAMRRARMETLSAETFAAIFDALREEYSYIIVDTPPLGFFVDAEIIADASDASLLVVRQDSAATVAINDAIDTLSESRAKFLGYVLNNVRSARNIALHSVGGSYSYGYGYGYGRKYGYGYGYGKSSHKEDSENGGK